ncbi:MAG TPA: ribonuclease PH [Gemmatimonadales bacterium]|nr:ribonuclease PH [Gemmatimonadales bacterium]
MSSSRPDGRTADALRPLSFERGATPHAEGSCLVRLGGTVVLCTATVEAAVPAWRKGTGLGWVTAEYAMLPRATLERTPRERSGAGGRTHEIQRLIGRSVRAALRGFDFGEHTIRVDCDVLQADGGTRTTAICGATVALADACAWLSRTVGVMNPFARLVAAVSVGLAAGEARLDLSYAEDRDADVDANIVVAEPDRLVEVQATAERGTYSRAEMDRLLDLAMLGASRILAAQRAALERS